MDMESVQLNLFGEAFPPPAAKNTKAKDPRLKYWAVIEPDVELLFKKGRGPVVWGLGVSRGTAITDAYKWMKDHDPTSRKDMDDLMEDIEIGRFLVVRCSRKVFKEVDQYGGEIDFMVVPGVGAFLPDERKD